MKLFLPVTCHPVKSLLPILLVIHWWSFLSTFMIPGHVYGALPPVVFNNVSSVDGLPQNSGRAILQDTKGFIWIGTEDGLVRFNGYSMVGFRKNHENDRSLSDNYISSLAEDTEERIWVGTMGGGLNLIDQKDMTVQRVDKLATSDIRDIQMDTQRHRLWLATDKGLHWLDLSKVQNVIDSPHWKNSITFAINEVSLITPSGKPLSKTVSALAIAGDDLWFCTRGEGIGRYNIQAQSVTWYQKGIHGLDDDTFNTIFLDELGRVWGGSQSHGLVRVDVNLSEVRFIHYNTENSGLGSNDVMAIEDAGQGRLWVGSWNGGLALFHPDSGFTEAYRYRPGDQYTIASDVVMNIIRTDSGQIWCGTFDKGVCWFQPDSPFHTYRAGSVGKGELPSNLVWSFASSDKEDLWVGTGKGLARLNLMTRSFETPTEVEPAALWNEVRKDDIRALYLDKDELWIAARKLGVFKLQLSSQRIQPLDHLVEDGESLTNDYVRIIYKDSRDAVWFGATKGLNRLQPSRGKIKRYSVEDDNELSLPHYRIRSLFEDSQNRMWVGTSDGVLLLDKDGDPEKVIKYEKGAERQVLADTGVRGISEDDNGRIWFATQGGLSIYDEKTSKTIILREKDGLPSNSTYSAVSSGGFMWVSTLNGLARIEPDTLSIECYYVNDGLPDNEFNFNAYHSVGNGRVAFGTLSGFTVFSPQSVPGPERQGAAPNLQLDVFRYQESGIKVPVDVGEGDLTLDQTGNKITFEFGALNFGNRGTVQYDIKLHSRGYLLDKLGLGGLGAKTEWDEVGKLPRIAYNGLPPGSYNFQARARDVHGQWRIASQPVGFTVAPPPWLTLQAFILYLIVIAGITLMAVNLYSQRLRKKSAHLENLIADRTLQLEDSKKDIELKHHQLGQLLAAREKLFKAVAHELRTPLAVIISSLESVKEKKTDSGPIIQMAYERASRVGQLLDKLFELSKVTSHKDVGHPPFHLESALEEAISPFRSQLQHEQKTLVETIKATGTLACMEREVFLIVVSNLLSNCCKFTEPGGMVSISATRMDDQLEITVEDDGTGISTEDKDRIFNWFERGRDSGEQEGWGIGLAFCKEEIEAAGGTIRLDPQKRSGAIFTILLPLESQLQKNIPRVEVDGQDSFSFKTPDISEILPDKSYRLLIVEDDGDLLNHIPTLFPSSWSIYTVSDAATGYDKAIKNRPDLIITDLMLPGESGFDLTKRLKEDERTAHIPIIILTAQTGEEFQLASLGLSADSFISKPFSNKELSLKVTSLLVNRKKVFEHAKKLVFSTHTDESEENRKSTKLGSKKSEIDGFLEKLESALNYEVDLAAFTLEDVAQKMAMSKRTLQREMGRLGLSWREYKRLRKVRFAMDFLRDPQNLVGDVAEMCGYSSAAHFSKTFKEIVGESPTEWRSKSQKETKN